MVKPLRKDRCPCCGAGHSSDWFNGCALKAALDATVAWDDTDLDRKRKRTAAEQAWEALEAACKPSPPPRRVAEDLREPKKFVAARATPRVACHRAAPPAPEALWCSACTARKGQRCSGLKQPAPPGSAAAPGDALAGGTAAVGVGVGSAAGAGS